MELLKEIANISGKPGLYRILKPTRTGVIVESLDDKKEKSVVGATARVSVLKDISIYTVEHNESTKPLAEVLLAVYEQFGESVILDKQSDDRDFHAFLGQVAPDYDRDRVHTSDIKKLVQWYKILVKYVPEIFQKTEQPATDDSAEAVA